MPLVLVRVDSRLVHGQVVETWIPHTGADCLVVASDDLADNPSLRGIMELAVPADVRVLFCRVDVAVQAVRDVDREGRKAILLCASPADALRLFRAGVRFSSLNIGNIHFGAGKKEISPSVFFSPEDFEAVEALGRLGVSVDVRSTPFEAKRAVRAGRGE